MDEIDFNGSVTLLGRLFRDVSMTFLLSFSCVCLQFSALNLNVFWVADDVI